METAHPAARDGFPDAGHLLFAYGSLLLATGLHAVDAAMETAGPLLGRGFIHGRLYDLGDYPGAIPEVATGFASAGPKVWGTLVQVRDPAALFAVLDEYEGFDPENLPQSEFIRMEAQVVLPDAGRTCLGQVYFYNGPVEGKPAIASGDYLELWRTRGQPAQGRMKLL